MKIGSKRLQEIERASVEKKERERKESWDKLERDIKAISGSSMTAKKSILEKAKDKIEKGEKLPYSLMDLSETEYSFTIEGKIYSERNLPPEVVEYLLIIQGWTKPLFGTDSTPDKIWYRSVPEGTDLHITNSRLDLVAKRIQVRSSGIRIIQGDSGKLPPVGFMPWTDISGILVYPLKEHEAMMLKTIEEKEEKEKKK